MPNIRNYLKQIPILKLAVMCVHVLHNKPSSIKKLGLFRRYLADYRRYKKLPRNEHFSLETADLYPRITDNNDNAAAVDPIYFYQDAWCAKKIFENKPTHHYDIGSEAGMIGILSQFVPVTMIDIRPLPFILDGLSFIKGDITALPFADCSINSLSSICVIEHIGLGRYGDPLDPFGSEKAMKEMVRVLARGGSLYITVPVDSENRVYFNAHRAFTRDYILKLAQDLTLIEEQYIYGNSMASAYDPTKGFGTGLYHFKK
jgi:SAM-dependent methyltransferase